MNTGITIVSLGTGNPELLNLATIRALQESSVLVLRTGRHPLVSWLQENSISFSTFDDLYDRIPDFDLLCRRIAESLIGLSADHPVVYAVPDAYTDSSVRALFRLMPESLDVTVIPGTGFHDIHLSASLFCLNDAPVVTVPACELSQDFSYNPGCTLLITELDNTILAGEVKLFLSDLLGDDLPAVLLREGMKPVELPLWQLDRMQDIDHTSALVVPGTAFSERNRFVLSDLTAIMDMLRSGSGCPWDRIQTHESLRPYLVEEAWECVDSIDRNDTDHLCEELGDLLFQVVFHSSIGKSCGEFSINDVISSICEKMIRRHPHVFGAETLDDPDSVRSAWEKIKQEENGRHSVFAGLDDVSDGLPSLKYASKIWKKISGTGIVRSDPRLILKDIRDRAECFRSDPGSMNDEAISRLILDCTELCFVQGYDGEMLLHQAADRLKKMLKSAENDAIKDGKSLEHLTFDELGVYLKYVKDEIE